MTIMILMINPVIPEDDKQLPNFKIMYSIQLRLPKLNLDKSGIKNFSQQVREETIGYTT